MIINNSPLGFSKDSAHCDCASNNWSQLVALNDNPTWQITTKCDEITGGGRKLPCESNQIGPYSEDFKRYNDAFVEQGLIDSVLLGNDEVRFIAFDDTGNLFATEAGFLTPNTCYNISYTISGYVEGWIQTTVGAGTAKGPNARESNGTFSEIYCTDADGRLIFQVGTDDDVDPATFVLSNIFLNCIRYSQLYDIENIDPGDPTPTFNTLSSICKDDQVYVAEVLISLREVPFMVGQTYKICFTVSNSNAGSIDVLFGPTTPVTFSGNGRYCIEIEYVDATFVTQLQFEMSTDFVGCLSDITVYLVPVIQVELFDEQGEIVEDALETEQIGSTLKVEMNATVPDGCYRIGVADNCSNYRNQFYGNILDADGYYSELITNEDIGTWGPILRKDADNWELTLNGWADLPNGTHDFINYAVIRDSICYDKLYDGEFNVSIAANGNTIQSLQVQVQIAGASYQVTIPTPGATETFSFTDIISGENAEYEDTNIPCPSYVCDLIGRNALLINISATILKSAPTSPLIELTTGTDSTFTMDTDPQQFCPEYMSVPLKVTTAAPCDSLLIKYRNDNDAFDIDYTSEGYTEADGFYNKIRIYAKLWRGSWPRTTETQKNSDGTRTKYYADLDKKYTLSTEPLPEFMHDALSDALEHRTLIIDDKYLVSDTEDYLPDWNKSSLLAPVEVDLFLQQGRKLNTEC